MKVLFISENTLGHASYLGPFADYFTKHPELGIEPELLNATPLPKELAKKAERTIPLLRRFGLDLHFARWRKVVSAHVRELVDARRFEALVVNTQSIALDLGDIEKPVFVALDATFAQLSRTEWFSDPPLKRAGPRMIGELVKRERALFEKAARVLPWSKLAADSLRKDYAVGEEKVFILPPSVELPGARTRARRARLRGLFIGGDFKRKGGTVLLEAYRQSFRGRLELDIATSASLPSEEGIRVWRNLRANSDEWRELWNEVDFLILPSKLETFGIVLVEALAFGVPIISSRAGAAEEILLGGKAGMLLDNISVESISAAIEGLLTDRAGTRERAKIGRRHADTEYNLERNSARLANLLREKG